MGVDASVDFEISWHGSHGTVGVRLVETTVGAANAGGFFANDGMFRLASAWSLPHGSSTVPANPYVGAVRSASSSSDA